MPVEAPTRRLSRPALLIAVALAAVLVVGLAAILIGLSRTGAQTVTGPVSGARNATFELLDGTSSVRVRAGAIGDDLYRITAPDGSGLVPRVDRDGADVRLHLSAGPDQGSGGVEIVLNDDVGWTVRIDGGTQETTIDLTAGAADGVQLTGGSSRIDVALPKPSKPVTVEMTGGADQFRVRFPDGTPTRVQVASGAGQVTLAGQTHQGVAGGQTFTTNGWQNNTPGIDVQARAGVGTLTAGPA